MNNNKKYKKWSLGLVAPALVLAPIAVVASCSSSGEEKPAYGVTFTNNNEIKATIHKAVQPTALTDVQFKEEVLAHKSDLFTIEGTLPSDNFLNDNIEITELTPNNDEKKVSANVKLNKANTNGESIDKTITLTGLGYEETDLTTLTYKISFKDDQSNPQEITLTDQGNISVGTLTAEKLIDLVLTTDNKAKILDITGNDATKITDEVLANQILKVTELKPAATEGKITFKLSVEKPENGAGNTLDKEITFAGFKQETDSTPPATEQFKIKFKSDKEITLDGVSNRPVGDFSTGDDLKPIIIKNKEKIFEAEVGNLPGDDWWNDKLTISSPRSDAAQGQITVNISLDKADTTAADPDNATISENDIILKGFQKENAPVTGDETTAKTEVSTVTLGLNGNRDEVKALINEQWVFDHLNLLFDQGTDLVTDVSGIVNGSVLKEDLTGGGNPIKLKFKLAANKWYDSQGAVGTNEKEFAITIKGISATPVTGTTLKEKFGKTSPSAISLIDPALSTLNIDDAKVKLEDKEFIFKYMKNFLTGDFSLINTSADLVKDTTLQVTKGTNELTVAFQIPEQKTLTAPGTKNPNAVSITFKLNGFATK